MSLRRFIASMFGHVWAKHAVYSAPTSFYTLPTRRAYPEQSLRQERPKYYTTNVNGFLIMQRLPRHAQVALSLN